MSRFDMLSDMMDDEDRDDVLAEREQRKADEAEEAYSAEEGTREELFTVIASGEAVLDADGNVDLTITPGGGTDDPDTWVTPGKMGAARAQFADLDV